MDRKQELVALAERMIDAALKFADACITIYTHSSPAFPDSLLVYSGDALRIEKALRLVPRLRKTECGGAIWGVADCAGFELRIVNIGKCPLKEVTEEVEEVAPTGRMIMQTRFVPDCSAIAEEESDVSQSTHQRA